MANEPWIFNKYDQLKELTDNIKYELNVLNNGKLEERHLYAWIKLRDQAIAAVSWLNFAIDKTEGRI